MHRWSRASTLGRKQCLRTEMQAGGTLYYEVLPTCRPRSTTRLGGSTLQRFSLGGHAGEVNWGDRGSASATGRDQDWGWLSRRIAERLHHMTSHGTRNQMARMLRYSNAAPHVVKGVKYFRCPSCDRVEPEARPQVVRGPDPYVFNEEIGLDIFTVKDVFDKPYQILHILCLGTCFHVGESLGQSQGVPSSRKRLEILLRSWIGWAGQPRSILVDRGTHNRGIFMAEMEKRGCRFKLAALEAPYQLGKVEVQMVLAECLETKNRQGTVGGFSPSQWVIGKNPRSFAWQDEAEDDFLVISDQDPTSSFNRRAGFRESAKLAWAHEDSHRRVRAAILRKGGSPEEEFRPGDMVSFMRRQKTGGWIGPARVLACEGKNLWLLHAGIPVLVASNRVRGANAEEHLEVELLNKHRLSRKRPFMDPEAVNQGHRLGEQGQVPYIDMRPSGIGLGSPDSPGGDESPKKARGVVEEEIEFCAPEELEQPRLAQPQHQLPLQQPESSGQPDSSRQPVATQLTDGTVEDSAPVHVGETVVVTDAELDAILGPEVPEPERPRREGRSSQRESRKKGEDKVEKDRSRSPHGVDKDRDLALKAISVALSHEFLCFMAKRKGKPDNNELVYSKVDEAMQKRLDQSRAKEWTNWLKYQAIRFPEEDEASRLIQSGHQAIPMRWVDFDKNAKLRLPDGPEVPEKLKSRLVIRGDLERENFRTDCPTASHTSIHLLLAYAATKDLELHSGDITAAFLQGAPIERTLLLRAPKDGIPTEKGENIAPYTYLVALMSVYGSKDAPRGFWLELRKELVEQGLTEIDPAFYVLIDEGETCGLLCSHVDDLLWVGNSKMDETMERVQRRFTFGSKEDGSFTDVVSNLRRRSSRWRAQSRWERWNLSSSRMDDRGAGHPKPLQKNKANYERCLVVWAGWRGYVVRSFATCVLRFKGSKQSPKSRTLWRQTGCLRQPKRHVITGLPSRRASTSLRRAFCFPWRMRVTVPKLELRRKAMNEGTDRKEVAFCFWEAGCLWWESPQPATSLSGRATHLRGCVVQHCKLKFCRRCMGRKLDNMCVRSFTPWSVRGFRATVDCSGRRRRRITNCWCGYQIAEATSSTWRRLLLEASATKDWRSTLLLWGKSFGGRTTKKWATRRLAKRCRSWQKISSTGFVQQTWWRTSSPSPCGGIISAN